MRMLCQETGRTFSDLKHFLSDHQRIENTNLRSFKDSRAYEQVITTYSSVYFVFPIRMLEQTYF